MTRRQVPVAPVIIFGALGAFGAWRIASLGHVAVAIRLASAAVALLAIVWLLGRGSDRWARSHDLDAFTAVLESRPPATPAPEPPERLGLRTTVQLSVSDGEYAHRRLVPLLRELADARLDAVHGIHLDTDPRAAQLLGPAAWNLLRPDRPRPADRFAAGPTLPEIDAAVTGIARLDTTDDAPGVSSGAGR